MTTIKDLFNTNFVLGLEGKALEEKCKNLVGQHPHLGEEAQNWHSMCERLYREFNSGKVKRSQKVKPSDPASHPFDLDGEYWNVYDKREE